MLFDPFAVLKWPIMWLQVVGIWLEKDAKWFRKLLAVFIHLASIDLNFSLQLIYFFTVETFDEIQESLRVLGTLSCLIIKSLNCTMKLDQIKDLMTFTKDLMSHKAWLEKSQAMRVKAQVDSVTRIFKVLGLAAFFSFLSICFVPIRTHELSAKTYVPFDHQLTELKFWLTAAFEYCGLVVFVPSIIILQLIPVLFMAIAVGFIEELNDYLEQLDDNDEGRLIECIQIHLQIYEYVKRIEKIFSPMIMIQGLVSTVILCTTCIMIIKVSCSSESEQFVLTKEHFRMEASPKRLTQLDF